MVPSTWLVRCYPGAVITFPPPGLLLCSYEFGATPYGILLDFHICYVFLVTIRHIYNFSAPAAGYINIPALVIDWFTSYAYKIYWNRNWHKKLRTFNSNKSQWLMSFPNKNIGCFVLFYYVSAHFLDTPLLSRELELRYISGGFTSNSPPPWRYLLFFGKKIKLQKEQIAAKAKELYMTGEDIGIVPFMSEYYEGEFTL